MAGALDGLRVVELGGEIAAPYATKLLGLLGAEVIKVEPPSGDPLRAWGPFAGDVADPHLGGGLFRYLNTDKRSVVADLSSLEGAALVRDLMVSADVVVEHLGAGGLEHFGIGPDALGARTPVGLVRISDFGQHGPHVGVPSSSLVVQAMGGWVSTHGIPHTHPVQTGGRLHEFTVGSFAACAALTVARAARRAHTPIVADLSMLECATGTLAYPMLLQESFDRLGFPRTEERQATIPGIVACKDGWVGINALTGQHWQDICAMLDAPEFANRQTELTWGGAELEAFFERVRPWLQEHTVEEIVGVSQAFRIPAAPVGDGRSVPRFAQFRARPFFTTEPGGELPFPGPPWRMSATPAAARVPAPVLPTGPGAPPPWAQPRFDELDEGGDPEAPFAGLRVVDLGTFWAAPYLGMYLGAFGADVVKVESIQRPDGFRYSGAFPQEGDDWYERSPVWQAANLNKRDLTLDLTRPDGRELLERLVAGADVVLENFSARVVEQFGLGYDELRAIKPDIIMVRMPGFGLEGPWRDYVGWAMGLEQASGMAQVTGYPPKPMHPGGFLDPVIGMHAGVAVQAALRHRARTGEGQMIEIAQLETAVCMTADQFIDFALNERVAVRTGNRHPVYAPQGVYRCADDRYVALTVRNNQEWGALLEAMGRPLWDSEDFRSARRRRALHDDIDEYITEWTQDRDVDDVVTLLRRHGVPAGAVITASLMLGEPQLNARDYYVPLDHPLTGVRRYPGWPMRFSFGGPQQRTPPPTLGQHNAEILAELGVDDAELERLTKERIIGTRV
ncbi:MAG TPA: CoA transferase [Acidimicrobiia bacterium]|nr:CoA transferase [Acidimicrobiia bacterium]